MAFGILQIHIFHVAMLLLDVTVKRDEVGLWIPSLNCCQKRCMRKSSTDDIWHVEVQFNERRETGKRNLVFEFLFNESQINDSGKYETALSVRGESVCRSRSKWPLAHNVNEETLHRILNINSKMVIPKTLEVVELIK